MEDLDYVLTLENECLVKSYNEGYKEGLIVGRKEGHSVGKQHGKTAAENFGYHYSFSLIHSKFLEQKELTLSEQKALKLLKSIIADADEVKKYQNDLINLSAVHDILQKIQQNFNKACLHLKIRKKTNKLNNDLSF